MLQGIVNRLQQVELVDLAIGVLDRLLAAARRLRGGGHVADEVREHANAGICAPDLVETGILRIRVGRARRDQQLAKCWIAPRLRELRDRQLVIEILRHRPGPRHRSRYGWDRVPPAAGPHCRTSRATRRGDVGQIADVDAEIERPHRWPAARRPNAGVSSRGPSACFEARG